MTTTTPELDKKYMLHHERFGRATVKVTRIDDEWADCQILSGELRGMTETWSRGDIKTVRLCHCNWTPVKQRP